MTPAAGSIHEESLIHMPGGIPNKQCRMLGGKCVVLGWGGGRQRKGEKGGGEGGAVKICSAGVEER